MTEERIKLALAALSLVLGGIIAFTGHDGWGWFLFIAVLFAGAW